MSVRASKHGQNNSTTQEEYMIKRWCLLATLFLASAAMAAVDVNKATEADLDGLNGVGPATTQLILKERKKGDFKDWADLMHRVKGIGDARANKLSAAGLTVSGASYKDKPHKDKEKAAKASHKSADDKPATLTPAAVKPLEKKSMEAKPTDGKPTEGKPANSKP
jgi:competence protein ComEA